MTFNRLFDEWVNALRQTEIQSPKHRKRKHPKPTEYTPSKKVFSDILRKMVDDRYLKRVVDEKSKSHIEEY